MNQANDFNMAGKVGMDSFGFTCFFNVVVQALAHVEPVSIMVRGLPLKFAHNSGVKTTNEDEKNQRIEFAYLFQRTLRELWTNKRAVVNSSYLLRSLNRTWSLFDEEQLEVHDIFAVIVDTLHRSLAFYIPKHFDPGYTSPSLTWRPKHGCELWNKAGCPDITGEFIVLNAHDVAITSQDVTNGSEEINEKLGDHFLRSIVSDTLQGATICRIHCKHCGCSTVAPEPFVSISLDFPEKINKMTLATPGAINRRASTVMQRADGSEGIEVDDLIVSSPNPSHDAEASSSQLSEYGIQSSNKTSNIHLHASLAEDGNMQMVSSRSDSADGELTSQNSLSSFNKGKATRSKQIRLHRETSDRLWCKRGNGIDSIRVPCPVSSSFLAVRANIHDGSNIDNGREESSNKVTDFIRGIGETMSPNKKIKPETMVTFEAMLDNHFRRKILPTERYTCPSSSCKNRPNNAIAIKSVAFAYLPEVLVFNIRRGTFSPSKAPPAGTFTRFQYCDILVKFPMENLDLSRYTVESPWYKDFTHSDHGIPMYDLQSVIVYTVEGGAAQGHHINYSRHFEEGKWVWYRYDNEKVKEVSAQVVKDCKPVMLYYVKQKPYGYGYIKNRLRRRGVADRSRQTTRINSSQSSFNALIASHNQSKGLLGRLSVFKSNPRTSTHNGRMSIVPEMMLAGNNYNGQGGKDLDFLKETTELLAKSKQEVMNFLRGEALNVLQQHDQEVRESEIIEDEDSNRPESTWQRMMTSLNTFLFGEVDDFNDRMMRFQKTSAGRILSNTNVGTNYRRSICSKRYEGGEYKFKLGSYVRFLLQKMDAITEKLDRKDLNLCPPNFHDPGGLPIPGFTAISTYWLLKFISFSDPGPVCNHDITCIHGALKPHIRGLGRSIYVPIKLSLLKEMIAALSELYDYHDGLHELLDEEDFFGVYSKTASGTKEELHSEQRSKILVERKTRYRPVCELEICSACTRHEALLHFRRRREKHEVLRQRLKDEKAKLSAEEYRLMMQRSKSSLNSETNSNSSPIPLVRADSMLSNTSVGSGGSVNEEIRQGENTTLATTTPSNIANTSLSNLGGTSMKPSPIIEESNVKGSSEDKKANETSQPSPQSQSTEHSYSNGMSNMLGSNGYSNDSSAPHCYIIDKKWLDRWRVYVSTDAKEDIEFASTAPHVISNYTLFQDGDVSLTNLPPDQLPSLRKDLELGVDYEAVAPGIWRILHRIYNGGPVLKRYSTNIYEEIKFS